MLTASAPGKIILFGEHAVVYGQPAIAIPVSDVQATVTVEASENGRQRILSPVMNLDIHLDECLPGFWGQEVLFGVQRVLDVQKIPGFVMEVKSTIPVASGMGSGAAVAVASIRALSEFAGQRLDDEQVNAIAYEIEKLHHGTPSGIDNTVILTPAGLFVRDQPIETFLSGRPITRDRDTGIPAPPACPSAMCGARRRTRSAITGSLRRSGDRQAQLRSNRARSENLES
jgi:mevalonate kinase